jgi:prevent-host-death family protein
MPDTILTVTEAARKFSDMVNRARYRHESTILVKNGVPVARVVPAGGARTIRKDLLDWWRSHPRLGRAEAARMTRAASAARKTVKFPRDPWE